MPPASLAYRSCDQARNESEARKTTALRLPDGGNVAKKTVPQLPIVYQQLVLKLTNRCVGTPTY
jgi:hypothetical protein